MIQTYNILLSWGVFKNKLNIPENGGSKDYLDRLTWENVNVALLEGKTA
jgi:hypothetical protein